MQNTRGWSEHILEMAMRTVLVKKYIDYQQKGKLNLKTGIKFYKN